MLAAELIDIIMDFLRDDKPALAACSLAGRIFLPASQFHLLESTNLCCYKEAHMQQFFSSLESPSLAPYI
jgi:hypothetical protein